MSKIAFMFPGQGAQKAGMGKDFYEQSETARQVVDKAIELLGIDMKALCFEENDKLDQTEYTQVALVTVCMAMEHVVRERGLNPGCYSRIKSGRVLRHCFRRRHEHRRRDCNSKKARYSHAERGSGRKRIHGGGSWNDRRRYRESCKRNRWRNNRQLQLPGTDRYLPDGKRVWRRLLKLSKKPGQRE